MTGRSLRDHVNRMLYLINIGDRETEFLSGLSVGFSEEVSGDVPVTKAGAFVIADW